MVNRLLSCKINKAFKAHIKNTTIFRKRLDSKKLSSASESAESKGWEGFESAKRNTILQISIVIPKTITDNQRVGFIMRFIDTLIYSFLISNFKCKYLLNKRHLQK